MLFAHFARSYKGPQDQQIIEIVIWSASMGSSQPHEAYKENDCTPRSLSYTKPHISAYSDIFGYSILVEEAVILLE